MGIFCDAGFECVSLEFALQHFSKDEISDWFRHECGYRDEDEDEGDLELLATELGISEPDWENDAAIELWNNAVDSFDFLPQKTPISVIMAKAVCGAEKWISPISLAFSGNRCTNNVFFKYEYQAILLGVRLREHFNSGLPVINDSKDAVKRAKQEFPNILWQQRKTVASAHNLRLADATKILRRNY